MREIVTIQVGDFANYIGSHFWNFQDELLGLVEEPHGDPIFKNSSLDMDVLYRAGETQQGLLTYSPRLISIGFKGSLGSLSSSGSLFDNISPYDTTDIVTWTGNVSRCVAEPHKKNLFLQSLCEEDQPKSALYANDPDKQKSSPHNQIQDKDQVECLESGVKFWTDFSKVQYHPRSLYELCGSWTDVQKFDNYGIGKDVLSAGLQIEEMSERLRFFVEECDHIQGIQFIIDDSGGFSSVAAEYLENIADEYANTPVLLYAARDPGAYSFPAPNRDKSFSLMAVVANAWGAPQPVRISLAKTPRLSPLSLARRRFSASSQRPPTEGPLLLHAKEVAAPLGNSRKHLKGKPRVFFLDVNPLCYEGAEPSLRSFARWLALFFDEVSLRDPIIAVFDGEEGNEYRRQLLPSYKAHRRRVLRQFLASQSCRGFDSRLSSAELQVIDVLQKCRVPVIKVNGYEADDVVATLTDQVLQKGFRVVIGSPDKDFKQLISGDVQMVMPMPEFGRWSFYTLRHYHAQYKCDPSSDLSLRCFMGDEADGVPGIQRLAPSFGRKTALKLLKKHGSLENLLNAAAIRTVGKDYAQDVLTKYADYLRKNYEVLSLRRDANVQLEEDWLSERDTCNDSAVLSNFISRLGEG